jgi:hypothetical protein
MTVAHGPADTVPTTECRVCQVEVPAGEFCGLCGVRLQARPGDGPEWLRPRNFGAAPGEHLLQPSLTSSLFPQLPARSRKVFGVALMVVLLALVTFAVLRMPGCLIAVAALGLPLLFLLYLHETDAHRDLPVGMLILAAVLGIALGVGWVLLTGEMVARSYGVPLRGGIALSRLMRDGIGVPLGAAVLALTPALIVRLMDSTRRESLDGFMIGGLGALSFTAAATLTRLAPQLLTGMVNRNRPTSGLLVEAGIRGVSVPLTALAAGGLLGTALWFRRPASKADQHPGVVRAILLLSGVSVICIFAAVGLVDVATMPQWVQLLCHLGVAVLAVVLLRVGLHLALLHEAHDEIHSDELIQCTNCGHVVPDMAFCPDCGVATRASSRSSRRARRESRPAAVEGSPGDYAVPAVRRTSYRRLARTWGVGVAVVALALAGLSLALTKAPVRYACPPNCGKPPTGKPVETNPRFTADDGTFSVSYPAAGAAYKVRTNGTGVTADLIIGDGGTLQLFSEPAAGRSPKDIAAGLVRKTFPDAKTAYQIPNTMVGYQPGYGEAADCWPQGANASYSRMRVLVMVAVKNDVALVASAVGPYHAFGPDFGPGPPSGANLEIAEDMGKYVNSFAWRGDPER